MIGFRGRGADPPTSPASNLDGECANGPEPPAMNSVPPAGIAGSARKVLRIVFPATGAAAAPRNSTPAGIGMMSGDMAAGPFDHAGSFDSDWRGVFRVSGQKKGIMDPTAHCVRAHKWLVVVNRGNWHFGQLAASLSVVSIPAGLSDVRGPPWTRPAIRRHF